MIIFDNLEGRRFEKQVEKVRNYTFRLNYELVQVMTSYSLLYKLLVFIEFVQMLYFCFTPQISNIWDNTFIQYGYNIFYFTQAELLLPRIINIIHIMALILINGLLSLFLGTVVYLVVHMVRKKGIPSSTTFNLCSTLSGGFVILFSTVLMIPIL